MSVPSRNPSAIVVGGGIAGLSAALSLARAGVGVTLLDARPADPTGPVDGRTTAVLQPGLDLFLDLGILARIQPESAPLRRLRLVSEEGAAAREALFAAHELGLDAFGWNIPNGVLREALLTAAREAGVLSVVGASVAAVMQDDAAVETRTANGSVYRADLLVAADGARSTVRDLVGIETSGGAYDQTAIVTAFEHTRPHYHTSTEIHRPGGPFTLVPMPGRRSSLIWGESRDEARRLLDLPHASFCQALQERVAGRLGAIKEVRPPTSHATGSMRARRLAAGRVLLLGEAAHTLSPVGAQGFNLSLRDAEVVGTLARRAIRADTFDVPAMAAAYERDRAADMGARVAFIDLLARLAASDSTVMQRLRGLGLVTVAGVPPLRRMAMQGLMQPVAPGRWGFPSWLSGRN